MDPVPSWGQSLLEEEAKGPFKNYVYKRRGVGNPKMSIFAKVHKVENANREG